jgi:hypothetical protein
VTKVRTEIGGGVPGHQILEIRCGGLISATERATESVKKLTEQYRQLGDAIRRAKPEQTR